MTAAAVMLWLTVTVTIPHPDLSAAEPSVREQIGAARAALENEAGGSPRKAELHGALGMIYHAYDLTAAADACYRNAIALAPEFRWHYYLGHVLAEQGDADGAVAAFKAALRLDPGYLPANLRLARLQLERQQLDEAERLYRRVLAADADEAEALTGLGRVAFARRDYTSALSHLQAALRRAPHATEIHHLIGLSYVRLKQRDRAREFLARGGSHAVATSGRSASTLCSAACSSSTAEARSTRTAAPRCSPTATCRVRSTRSVAASRPGRRTRARSSTRGSRG
jgi:Tfp pilus assembly protein PilF